MDKKDIGEIQDASIIDITKEDFILQTEYPPNEVLGFHELCETELIQILAELNENEIIAIVPVAHTLATKNIRPINQNHAIDLGLNIINTKRQLSPCIADLSPEGLIRIQAGDHRRRGIGFVTKWQGELFIRLSKYTMSPEEELQIKIDENLNHPMTTLEKANVYYELWLLYNKKYPNKNRQDFADLIGVNPQILARALHFNEDLDPNVQGFVDEKLLFFSQALIFLPFTKDQQLREAVHAIVANLSTQQIRKRVERQLAQENVIGLFDPEFMAKELRRGSQKAFNIAMDRETRVSIGYLNRISALLLKKHIEDEIPITDAAVNNIRTLILTAYHFLLFLQESYPNVYEKLRLDGTDRLIKL